MQKISAAKTILYFSLLIVFILSIVSADEIPRFKDLSLLSDKLVHFFHPYRFFEYLDLLANLIGVTIALLIFELKNNKSY